MSLLDCRMIVSQAESGGSTLRIYRLHQQRHHLRLSPFLRRKHSDRWLSLAELEEKCLERDKMHSTINQLNWLLLEQQIETWQLHHLLYTHLQQPTEQAQQDVGIHNLALPRFRKLP
jgi:hypothetical protein